MDLSWLPPVVRSGLELLGAAFVGAWVQHLWQERERRSAEKRARLERRFKEVREFLISVMEVALEFLKPVCLGALSPHGADGKDAHREWLDHLHQRADEKVFGSRVAVMPDLFVQDEVLMERLEDLLAVIDRFFVWAERWPGEDPKQLGELWVDLTDAVRQAQEKMDRIEDEV